MNHTTLEDLDDQLNRLIRAGKLVEGVERFYSDDTSMGENVEPPTVGRQQNLERERGFVDSLELAGSEFRLVARTVGDGVTMSEWLLRLRFKGSDAVVEQAQVAVRRWRGGKVVAERFYHA